MAELPAATLKRLFDAIRTVKGGALTQGDVDAIHRALADPIARTLTDAESFYRGVRAVTGPLDQTQVDVIEAMLKAAAHWSTAWLAYGLATAWHEARLRPIREKGTGDGPDADPWDDYLQRYDTGKLAAALGNTPEADGDGVRYAGRGLVQLTGRSNYLRVSAALGVDMIADPDLALRPDIAVAVLVRGMEEGWFTSRSLSTYLPAPTGNLAQFTEARRIINGTDRAAMIAGQAMQFQDALLKGGWK